MKCEATNVPLAEEIDIPAMREKYRRERDKRLRPEGQGQYAEPVGDFANAYESDPHMPVEPRDPISGDIDVAILGAGFCGMLTSIQLKEAGISNFRNIDWAGDWGGCWYWNRYPGIQCDNDAYCYLPLLEETGYMPKKKFEDGWDIYQHSVRIAKHHDLYPHAIFHTLVTALRWDEEIGRWRLATNRGDDIRARFIVMAGGPLNKPKLPGIPGLRDFKGKIFHTARWEYEYTGGSAQDPVLDRLADKRVAIIGTGATAVQVVPYLGKYAGQVYVIQRTPSSVDERNNTPTDPEWVKTLKPGWQKERQMNFHHGAMERFAPGEPDMVCDIWTEVSRNLSAKLQELGWPEIADERYAEMREVVDYQVMERLRRRVDSIVEDRETAEALKPYYRFLCKRPCSNDDYYPTFNRPNVKLIDVSSTQGVERMTEKGFVHDGVEYEVDCVILASGFEITSELRKRWGIDVIEGRNGVSIYDHWAHGYKTLHGMMTHGFPNQFFTGFTQAGLNATNSVTFVSQGRHIGYIVSEALKRGAATVEPSEKAQEAWVRTIRDNANEGAMQFAQDCTPGYFNNEGEKEFRWYLGEPYGAGFYAFEELLGEWRNNGDLEGLVLGTGTGKSARQGSPSCVPSCSEEGTTALV
jgi:cation diffusion facilitator CzcD-associated flavoprotein CzcO